MVAQTAERERPRPGSPGLIATTLGVAARLLIWLVLAWIASVIVEWAGMFFGWWGEAGVDHARGMLAREIDYLHTDFRRTLITSTPARFAGDLVAWGHHWLFEASGLIRLLEWLEAAPAAGDNSVRLTLRAGYIPLRDYIAAAMAITHLFLVRLAILALASPVFLLAGLVALVDGLGQRDLRRWSGGRESSFLYHHAKALVLPLLLGAWVVYLALPVSVHPTLVILPFAVLFGMAVAVTAGAFKKYL